ncbi:MAG: hypothetical protein Q8Q95_01420 [bacterium]|nr:hypothetical protein [bacterium]
MSKENIYIELHEDIQSAMEKIQSAEADTIDLVIPTGARILQNIVDAHLIKDIAEEYGKDLTVITSDLMGKIFAERAGLAVAGLNGDDESGVMASPAIATTGRISDIIPRKRGIPIGISSQKKQQAVLTAKTKAMPRSSHISKSSDKKAEDFYLKKNKGENGASFLKSYREERSKAGVFNELRKINRKKFLSPSAFVGLVVVVALAVSFAVFSRVLPKADILIYPTREAKNGSVDVFVSGKDSKINLEKGLIPGELLTSEKMASSEFVASGTQSSSDKAKGKITIYNTYSTQVQKFVPSRFQSESSPSTGVGAGKIFWTTASVNVPGYTTKSGKIVPGEITTNVIAAEGGDSYNIAPSKFTMPAFKGTAKGNKIYAVSKEAMTGGGAQGAKIVSNDDATNAYDSLKEKIKPEFDLFKQNLPQGFKFWPEAYNEELASSSVSPEVGVASEKFTATVKMVARAIVFKNDDLDAYINKRISNDIDESKTLLTSSKDVSFLKQPLVDYQKGTVSATLNVKYDVMDEFNMETFKKSVLNKKKKDIDIADYKADRIEVNLWPFWVRSIPSNPDRVNVSIIGL